MAAWVAMSLLHRRWILRATVLGAAVATLVQGTVGCARVVDGTATQADPQVGEPVRWQPCKFVGGVESDLPAKADCGRIAVPGNSPPKSRKEIHVPSTGVACMIPWAIRRPVPDRRSSGSE